MTSFPFQIGIHGIQIEFVNHNGDIKTATYLPEVAPDHGAPQCSVGVWFCTRSGFVCLLGACVVCDPYIHRGHHVATSTTRHCGGRPFTH